jgi:hypothetical protein
MTMTSDLELTDEMEPFYLADCEAMTETQAELGQEWTEEAYMDRLAEKGYDPLTGKPLADLQAYKEQQRDRRIWKLIEWRERLRRSMNITEDLIEESREEYAQAATAVDALNLSPADLERFTAEAVQNVEDWDKAWEQRETERRRRELEALKSVSAFSLNREIRVLLIWADEPDHIAGLEAACGMTQAESIDDWIEESCWSDDEHMKPFVGGKGTPEERRAAFRYALALQGTYPQ